MIHKGPSLIGVLRSIHEHQSYFSQVQKKFVKVPNLNFGLVYQENHQFFNNLNCPIPHS